MEFDKIYFLIEIGLIMIIIIGIGILIGVTLAKRDVAIIVNKPLIFLIELLMMSFIPGVPLLFFVVSRGVSLQKALTWFYALAIKFGILHLLFQTSGFYSYTFSDAGSH